MKILKVLLLCSIGFISSKAVAQLPEDARQTVNDLLFLADGFASPASNSAAYQATAGWFSSAASLDEWKVDVSVHANALFVPSSKQEYTVNAGDFSVLKINEGQNGAVIPTAFGKQSDVVFNGSVMGNEFSFNAIEGIDKSALVHPFIEVAVGLPFETEISVRALPELDVDGSKFSTYGVGIKHNLSQYFRFNEEEDLQLAAIATYNIFDVKYEFTQISIPDLVNLNLIDVNANVWMAEFMASKRYENFEIFGALGVAQSSFDYQFDGSGIGLPIINTELEALSDQEAQFKGDIGFNLYFNKFKISTMATAGNFFNINLGLHFLL